MRILSFHVPICLLHLSRFDTYSVIATEHIYRNDHHRKPNHLVLSDPMSHDRNQLRTQKMLKQSNITQQTQTQKQTLSFLNRQLYASKQRAHIESSQTKLPSPRSDLTSTIAMAPSDEGVLTMGIYLIGGCDHYHGINAGRKKQGECASVTNNTWVYEPYEDKFVNRRDMSHARFRHVSVSIEGDSIWVLTGRDENHHLISKIDVYTPNTDQWTTLEAELPPQLLISDGAAFSRGADLYVIGGYDNRLQATDQTFKIDTEKTLESGELIYSIMEPLITPRGDLKAMLFGRYAYAVGGFTHKNGFCAPLRTTEIYDIVTGTWMEGPDLNMGRGDPSLVLFNGQIFAIGGETTHLEQSSASCRESSINSKMIVKTYPVNSVEIFVPNKLEMEDQQWKIAYRDFFPPDNLVFRSVATAFPEKSVIYAFGGISHYGGESDETREVLKTSDKVSLYVDDFKHGAFHGQSFASPINSSGFFAYSSNILLFSAFMVVVTFTIALFSKWIIGKIKDVIEKRRDIDDMMDDDDDDAAELVELN